MSFCFMFLTFIKLGRWSEIFLIKLPLFSSLLRRLTKILSIKVRFCLSTILVGSVMHDRCRLEFIVFTKLPMYYQVVIKVTTNKYVCLLAFLSLLSVSFSFSMNIPLSFFQYVFSMSVIASYNNTGGCVINYFYPARLNSLFSSLKLISKSVICLYFRPSFTKNPKVLFSDCPPMS